MNVACTQKSPIIIGVGVGGCELRNSFKKIAVQCTQRIFLFDAYFYTL
jgi:hypothetical protein